MSSLTNPGRFMQVFVSRARRTPLVLECLEARLNVVFRYRANGFLSEACAIR